MKEEDKVELLAHPPKAKTLMKAVVRASGIDDALKILQEAYPDEGITMESIIHWTVIKPSTQLELF